jgi:hypothetical protein
LAVWAAGVAAGACAPKSGATGALMKLTMVSATIRVVVRGCNMRMASVRPYLSFR